MKTLMLLNIGCLLSAVCFAALAMAKEKASVPMPPGWENLEMQKRDGMLKKLAIEESEIGEIHAKKPRLVIGPDGSSGVVTEGTVLPPGYRAAEEPVPASRKTGTSKGIPNTGPERE